MSEKSKQRDDTFEVFILSVLYRALGSGKPKFFTRESLASFICNVRDASVFLEYGHVVPPINAVDKILKALIRDGEIYTVQRRGERGTFEEHFMIAPYGVEALGKGARDWMSYISFP